MNLKEAYTHAMVESIKNSGMWLKQARLVMKKGSKGHAQALTIFAGEELGKALMCWMTISGVFPFNHWEVDSRHKKSVFHRHDPTLESCCPASPRSIYKSNAKRFEVASIRITLPFVEDWKSRIEQLKRFGL